MNARGFRFDVFTADSRGDSASHLPEGNQLILLAPGPLTRMAQVRAYLREAQKALHHVEVYPGGRYAWLYVALAKAAGVRVIVVERGDLLNFDEAGPLLRWSMRRCYAEADVVWFREPYQGRVVERLGARRAVFLPNGVAQPAVPTRGAGEPEPERDIDFLWTNRVILERHLDWFLDALRGSDAISARAAVLGLLPDMHVSHAIASVQERARRSASDRIEILEFTDPAAWYARARFFVLPSDIVFANHALLEAMAAGVVPIVSDTEGAREIVEDGVSGFLAEHSPSGLHAAMRRAMRTDEATLARMRGAARDVVARKFSATRWCEDLSALYGRLYSGTMSDVKR